MALKNCHAMALGDCPPQIREPQPRDLQPGERDVLANALSWLHSNNHKLAQYIQIGDYDPGNFGSDAYDLENDLGKSHSSNDLFAAQVSVRHRNHKRRPGDNRSTGEKNLRFAMPPALLGIALGNGLAKHFWISFQAKHLIEVRRKHVLAYST